MLVLTRNINETIIVTVGRERITIALVDIMPGRKARIGVEASDRVTIHRSEIQERIDAGELP